MNEYTAIQELMNMLKEADIPFDVEEHMNGYCVSYPSYGNCVCSAIEHDYSYGHTVNMIEIEGLLTEEEREIDSVCGYLSAKDVFERIKNHYQTCCTG